MTIEIKHSAKEREGGGWNKGGKCTREKVMGHMVGEIWEPQQHKIQINKILLFYGFMI